ncbi:Zinc finger CCHC domain-containing protein 7 [Chionoecetes opilio]|uniref:Zinc finger CCHC domain-containing protein 7 n=1 Tax=Chionoecetes opilio TaxID=41210 RepID=A0A8J8WF23_CHIOP|nr:Zinc finger CCHC domain-containing protein 7 [Chionoecetes opilio]
MNSHEDMSGLDQDSEFDSEEEDAEFLLYQQLYFEPNTDITEADVQRRLPTQGRHDGKSVFEPHDKHILQHSGCQLNTVQNSKHLPEMKNKASSHTLSTAASDIQEDQNPQIQDYIYIDTLESAELTLTDFNVEISMKNTHDPSTVQQSELHVSTGHEACAGAPAMRRKAVPARSVRERLSSTCSDGSIPGSVPLDALYCNLVTSEEEEEDINRMLLKDLETNNEKRKKEKAKANSNKRKRRKSSCSEGAPEDSRCSNLITAASKNAVSQGHVQQGAEDSHSDADIFILPPPEQRKHEILTLNSSSDSEGGEGNRAGTYEKIIRKNKYQKTEKSLSSPRKASNKDGKLKAVQQVSVRGRKQDRKKGCDLAAGSESDSNDVDMPEATKGTDLILNIDKSLSGWVRTITKDPNTPKKTKNVMKKPGKNSRPSVDFTKGRPDTTTAPSCQKWTQGMTNFYDSDVSDDLYVSEVHLQQSDVNFANKKDTRSKIALEFQHATFVPEQIIPVEEIAQKTAVLNVPLFQCGGEHHFVCPVADPWSSKCNLCGFPGHPKKLCPDLWRRFHLTTSGLVAQSPTECPTRPPGQRYCYSCGKRGHYGHDCPISFQNRSYSQVPQSVVSYCSPVTIADDGYFVVNLNEAQSTKLKDMTCAHEYAVGVLNQFNVLGALDGDPVEPSYQGEIPSNVKLQAAKDCIGEYLRSRHGFVSTENIAARLAGNKDQYRTLSRKSRTLPSWSLHVRSLAQDVEGHLNANELRPAYRALKKLQVSISDECYASSRWTPRVGHGWADVGYWCLVLQKHDSRLKR